MAVRMSYGSGQDIQPLIVIIQHGSEKIQNRFRMISPIVVMKYRICDVVIVTRPHRPLPPFFPLLPIQFLLSAPTAYKILKKAHTHLLAGH